MLALLKTAIIELGYPTEGVTAFRLWEYLSSWQIEASTAGAIYRELGYIPFSGYPLTKA